jgi:hypothetical protein
LEVIEQEGDAIMFVGVLEIVVHGPTSAGLNPPPVIITTVPDGPEAGLSAMAGVVDVTVKVAFAKSPPLPVTMMV